MIIYNQQVGEQLLLHPYLSEVRSYDRSRAITYLAEFLSVSWKETESRCDRYDELNRKEWDTLSPKTLEERNKYYALPIWIYASIGWHFGQHHHRLHLSKMLEGKILDFGCGVPTHSIWAAQRGVDIDLYELPGATKQFTEFVITKLGIGRNIRFVAPPFRKDYYDGVVCIDVLEHLEDPVGTACMLNAVLKRTGKLFFRAPDDSCFPGHIQTNFQIRRDWLDVAGFRGSPSCVQVEV